MNKTVGRKEESKDEKSWMKDQKIVGEGKDEGRRGQKQEAVGGIRKKKKQKKKKRRERKRKEKKTKLQV